MKEKFARFSEYLQKSRAEVERRNLCSLTIFSWVFFGLLGISHTIGVLGGTGGAPAFFSFAAPGAELLYAVLLTLTKGAPRRACIWIYAGGYLTLAGAAVQFAAFGGGHCWLFPLFLMTLAAVLTLPWQGYLLLFAPPVGLFLIFAGAGGHLLSAAEPLLPAAVLSAGIAALSGFSRVREWEERATDRRKANTDALTGVGNRYAFEAGFSAVAARGSFALAVMDLDRFKEINDRYGHVAGDTVLIEFCRFTERHFENCRPRPLFARLGGDEFTLLFDRVEDENTLICQLETFCEKIRRNTGAALSVPCSCSIGAVFVRLPEKNSTRVLAAADRELYRAKNQKGAGVCSARL